MRPNLAITSKAAVARFGQVPRCEKLTFESRAQRNARVTVLIRTHTLTDDVTEGF